MSKEQILKIGMAIQNIAMSVDDKVLERISPYLKDIESTVAEEVKDGDIKE